MPTLHVRNVSESLYEQLRLQAERQGRSLSAEVIILLERALPQPHSGRDQAAILDDIRRRRTFNPTAVGAPDSVSQIRAIRDGETPAYTAEREAIPDEELIAEALRLGQHETVIELLTAALAEYVLRRRQRAMIDLFGTIEYDADYDYKAQRDRS